MRVYRFLGQALVLCLAVAWVPAVARAGVLIDGGKSLSNLGSFTGSIDVVSQGTNKATLTISLTNTSPAKNGGYITAFVFNNPGDKINKISLTSAPSKFNTLDAGKNNINGAPFGRFDYVVTTKGGFEGGGKPQNGLGTSQTGTFVFSLTGSGVGSLTATDFTKAFSVPPGAGEGIQFLAVRFQGFKNGGSDKVAAAVVPEPSTSALALAALVPLTLAWWRRRSGPAPTEA